MTKKDKKKLITDCHALVTMLAGAETPDNVVRRKRRTLSRLLDTHGAEGHAIWRDCAVIALCSFGAMLNETGDRLGVDGRLDGEFTYSDE